MKLFIYFFILFLSKSFVHGAFYPPSLIKQPPKHATFKIGEALILPCKATGNPEPEYEWFKNGQKFDFSINIGRYTKWPKEGTLILAKPDYDDDGFYYCTAKNKRGIAVSNSADVRRAELQDFSPLKDNRRKTKKEGESILLKCNVPVSYPIALVQWEKGKESSREILKDSNKYVTDFDGNLYITRITSKEDNGATFTCTAFNTRLRERKTDKPYTIIVDSSGTAQREVKTMFRSTRNQEGLAGEKLTLRCIYGGNPQVNYLWKKKGMMGSVTDRPNIRIEAGGPLLVFDPITEMDEGIYQCIGDNDATISPQIVEFKVEVKVKPKLINRLSDNNVPVGGSIVLACTAFGTPTPSVNWFFNKQMIREGIFKGSMEIQSNKIILSNLQREDYGVFQCNATSTLGYDLSNGYVNVLQDKPEFINQPPSTMLKAEGQSVTLPCETFSAPRAIVSWSKDDYPISGGRYNVTEEGNLNIEELITADSGTFKCVASNSLGSVTGSTQLFVRQKTILMIRPKNTWVYYGQEVKFVCTAKTDRLETSNLHINWYKDRSLIDFETNDRIQRNLQDNSLIIMGAQTTDNGVYTCNATNGLDFAVAYAALVVQSIPFHPILIKAECNLPSKKGKATVSWIPGADNYAPIIQYILEYSTQYDRNMWWPVDLSSIGSTIIPGDKTSIDIPMRPAISYQFRVRAQNRVGISEQSDTTMNECKTVPAIPDKNPKELYVYGTQPGNLVIRWTPMPRIEHNDNTMNYVITIKCLECSSISDDQENTTMVPWTQSELIYRNFRVNGKTDFVDIERYKKFKAEIKAKNSKGLSSARPQVAEGYSGDGQPDIAAADLQSVELGAGYVTLKWTIFPENELSKVNGFFHGYRVEWCLDGLSQEKCNLTRKFQDVLLQENNIPVVFHNRQKRSLQDGSSAYNSIPLEPKDVEYHILYRNKRAVLRKPDDWDYGSKFTWKLTMLPGSKKIKVWIRVLNNLWAGPMSNQLSLTTNEDTPGPVQNFRALVVGINHVKVKWDKPEETNGKLVGVRLGWREIKGLELGYMTKYPAVKDPDATEFEMSGLRSATRYRILIWAMTEPGEGVESFIDITTLPTNIAPQKPSLLVESVVVNRINVTFEGSRTGIKGSVFFLQYRRYGQYRWDESEAEYFQKFIVIENLANDTYYQVRVVATNGAGMATPSDYVTVKTKGKPDPTRLVGDNAIWLICVIIILLLTILLMFFVIICRDKRMKNLIGEPTAPPGYFETTGGQRGSEEYQPIISTQGGAGVGGSSVMSQASSQPPRLPGSHPNDVPYELEEDFDHLPPESTGSANDNRDMRSNESGSLIDRNTDDLPPAEYSKPRKHRKKKKRPIEQAEPIEEVRYDDDDDVII